MRLINQTKNTVISEDVTIAKTFAKRLIGLLGRGGLRKGESLLIASCKCIHTLFMRFDIDVLFISKDGRIVKVISNLKPFRITGINFGASYVVELPVGTIQSSCSSEGDIIKLA